MTTFQMIGTVVLFLGWGALLYASLRWGEWK